MLVHTRSMRDYIIRKYIKASNGFSVSISQPFSGACWVLHLKSKHHSNGLQPDMNAKLGLWLCSERNSFQQSTDLHLRKRSIVCKITVNLTRHARILKKEVFLARWQTRNGKTVKTNQIRSVIWLKSTFVTYFCYFLIFNPRLWGNLKKRRCFRKVIACGENSKTQFVVL